MTDYVTKQNRLRQQAFEILKQLDLINTLNKYGKSHIVGSLALGLMSWEDIDIVLVAKPNYDNYLKVVDYLFRQKNIYALNLQDFRKSIYPNRPQGIYCGVTYLAKPKTFWKIDIWFMPTVKALDLVNDVKSKLTEENREIILKIKNEMRVKMTHGKEVSGMEVYKAVFKGNVTTLAEFKDYLKSQREKL